MKKVLFISLLVIISFNIKAQDERTEKIDKYINQLYNEDDFNGSILIAEKGNIIYKKHFGFEDIDTKKPLDDNSIFELASVTKQFTAAGIAILKRQGKLDYSDKVYKYIPELFNYPKITIEHLIYHTGGLPDYMDLMEKHWDSTKIATNDDMLKFLKDLKPEVEFKPNEKKSYSNTGYAVLASIIERTSGQSFGEFLKENIFQPLQMNNTLVNRTFYNPKKIKGLTKGHLFSKKQKKLLSLKADSEKKYFYYLDGLVGDGMVKSTLLDLLKWDRALYSEKVFSEAEKKLMFNGTTLSDGTKTDYGFGWFIEESQKYGKILKHSGGWAGYITYIERHLETDKTIIVLLNTSYTSLPNRKRLRHLIFNTWTDLSDKQLAVYRGKYVGKDSTSIELLTEKSRLFYNYQKKIKLELVPNDLKTFDVDGFRPLVQFTFKFDENEKIKSVRMTQEGTGIDKTYIKGE